MEKSLPNADQEGRDARDKRIYRLSCLKSAVELAQAKIQAGQDIKSSNVVEIAKLFENYVYEKKADQKGK